MDARPFLSLYTPTYRRPAGLAACLASVAAQTAADRVEQLVVVDHVGIGIAGMYARIPRYAPALHGQYVYLLADDDVLAGPSVVADLEALAIEAGHPPVIVCQVNKGGAVYPSTMEGPPRLGGIDLGCVITRADVWRSHLGAYGQRYEGDFDFVSALWLEGLTFRFWPYLFAVGAVSRGRPEDLEDPAPAAVRMALS